MRAQSRSRKVDYLDGQLLIAMPTMTDKRFARAVIYLCTHSADGAMGLILNQRAKDISFPQLLQQLGIVSKGATEAVPPEILLKEVHVGGPVDTKRGFVLHSADYHAATNTLAIDDGICLTATIDILKAMARGTGPDKAILALGYAGWAPTARGRDPAQRLLHCWRIRTSQSKYRSKYDQALAGSASTFASRDAGHA
jgi:putative transcriptional regulator